MRYQHEKNNIFPLGNNKLGSMESYNETILYDLLFPQALHQAKPMSFRAEIKTLYGKVDAEGYTIVPKMEYISQINLDTKETHRALYIVKECFEELSQYYSNLSMRGKLSTESVVFKELLPKRSWQNLSKVHKDYQNKIINNFISQKGLDSPEIKGYKTFEKNFMEYYKNIRIPFTISGYGASRYCSPLCSGLVIDLATEDASEDRVKYEGFIKDPNFPAFRKVINRFGFRFDIDVPWRIYFDITHPYSKKKMAKYGVYNLEQFFIKYYDRVVELEVEKIDDVMLDAYNTLYKLDSTYVMRKPCRKGTNTNINIIEREVVTMDKLNKIYQPAHWIRAYLFFRAIETKINWTQQKFEKIVREAVAINNKRGSKYMYQHIEPHFTNKANELFEKRDLTKQNSFDKVITNIKF